METRWYSRTGDTAYHGLAWTKDPDVVKEIADLLVERGLDPNTGPNMAGLTALGVAFRRRASTALCVLLDLGVKIPPIYTIRGCLHCRPYTTYVYHLLVRAGLQPTQQAANDMLLSVIDHNNRRLYEFLVHAYPPTVYAKSTEDTTGAATCGAEAKPMRGVEEQLMSDVINPRTLAVLTVNRIRRRLFKVNNRSSIFPLTDKLPLPKRLHRQINLNGLLEEKMITIKLCACEREDGY